MNRMTLSLALVSLSIFTPQAGIAAEAEPFSLQDGQTIVTLGDSITHNGHYVDCLDIFLATRLPGQRFTLINRGLSSETVAGTSEEGHPGGPRPDLHTRFERIVPPLAPDIVIACYGMNDGIYRSFNEETFAKYRAGMERLVERVRQEAQAEIILCTPPPFDRRPTNDRARKSRQSDVRIPARDYDATLAEFARWLKTFEQQGITVIDLHTPLNALLAERRKATPDYLLARDGVHQSPTGHMLMAAEILEALNAPPVVEQFKLQVSAADKSASPPAYQFEIHSKLPLPHLEDWDEKMIRLADIDKRLNRYTLTAAGLPAGRYKLFANGDEVGVATAEQLAAGLNLHDYPKFPTHARAQEVAKLIRQARAIRRNLWIKDDPHPRLARAREALQHFQPTAADAAALEQRARELAQPLHIELRLEPVD